jgi:flagellar biogenesis protein FliO
MRAHRELLAFSQCLCCVTLLAVATAAQADASSFGCGVDDRRSEQPAESMSRLPFAVVRADGSIPAALVGREHEPLPLAPPKRAIGSAPAKHGPRATGQSLVTVATSLAVVLGLFALLVWFTRRGTNRGNGQLPGEVVETLGRVPLNKQQEMHLVRVGNKLLLLAVTPQSAETLTEITDASEIERLTQLCQLSHPGKLTASFQQVLAQLHREADGPRNLSPVRF